MLTNDERRQAAREKKEREEAEVKRLFPERVKQVAAVLGLPFRFKDFGRLYAELGADKASMGRVINLSTADCSPDFRLSITGDYYMGPSNHTVSWPYQVDRPSITVSLRRDAEAIAKEIKTRFLPGYDAACTRIAELVKQSTDYRDKLRSNTDRLAAIVGAEVRKVQYNDPNSELQTEFFKYYGANYSGPKIEVKASRDGADISIDCGIESAAKILAAIESILGNKTNDPEIDSVLRALTQD